MISLTITPAAIAYTKAQLEKRGTPNAALRLGVKGSGGCEGFGYVVQFEDNQPTSKDTIMYQDGITILVDSKSARYLNGATLDYECRLVNIGFKITNPNEVSRCGCGLSVDLKLPGDI